MTITHSIMYWITRLDPIHSACGLTSLLGGFAIAIGIVLIVSNYTDSSSYDEETRFIFNTLKKWVKRLFFIWIFAIIGLIFIPTSKEMAMIYVLPSINESQVIKQDLPEIYDLGVKSLKEWLKEQKDK